MFDLFLPDTTQFFILRSPTSFARTCVTVYVSGEFSEWRLDWTQKIFIGTLDAVYPSFTTKKFFWPPWRSLRLVRPPRPKIFQKTSMAQNAQNCLIRREKQKKFFTHYKFSKASWPSVKGQKAVLNSQNCFLWSKVQLC